jgi:hypothetical protein
VRKSDVSSETKEEGIKNLITLLIVALILVTSVPACCPVPPVAGKSIVSIASPPNGAQVALGQEVLVQVSAVDSAGIARVELWEDNVLSTTAQPPSPQTSYTAVMRFTKILPWVVVECPMMQHIHLSVPSLEV